MGCDASLESVVDNSGVALAAREVPGNDVMLKLVSGVDDMELRVVRVKSNATPCGGHQMSG